MNMPSFLDHNRTIHDNMTSNKINHPAEISIAIIDVYDDFSDNCYVWNKLLSIVNSLPYVSVLASLKHDFSPCGMSGVVIIGESHVAIHTWPELNYAFVELATCGDPSSIDAFIEAVRNGFESSSVRVCIKKEDNCASNF